MQIFDVKAIEIKLSKLCSCCHNKQSVFNDILNEKTKMYYGHSNYKNSNGNCSVYICMSCAHQYAGYIADCNCLENL